jgi:hypothetical protein
MNIRPLKILCLVILLLMDVGIVHSQQPGVDCAPVQGQGWSGCAPINPSQQATQGQQPQVPQQPPERWQDHWGAIATYVPSGSLGSVSDMATSSQAEQTALADCRSKGGIACKIEISYRNQCVGMIVGHPGYSIALGPTVGEAIKNGMKMCTDAGDSNCHVYYSACSLPVRIQ